MREREALPGICYTDPTGVVRGPFDEWRILDWYRQGFFTNAIFFKLENDDAQFSLGELVDRFGAENPFCDRLRWRILPNPNGSPSVSTVRHDMESVCCDECRKNGEKLDALLSAVHRLQQSIDAHATSITANTASIASLRGLCEESRLSVWRWNSSENNDKAPSNITFPLLQETGAGVVDASNVPTTGCPVAVTKELNGENIWQPPSTPLDNKAITSDLAPTDIIPVSPKLSDVSVVESLVSSLRMSPSEAKTENTTPTSSPLLERIRKRGGHGSSGDAQPQIINKTRPPQQPSPQQQHQQLAQQQQNQTQQKENHNRPKNGQPQTPPLKPQLEHGRQQQPQKLNGMDSNSGPRPTAGHIGQNGHGFGGPNHRRTPPEGAGDNDWINANTRPSFHPFPAVAGGPHGGAHMGGVGGPGGPPQHQPGNSPWPGLNQPPPPPHNIAWSNPYAPLQQMQFNPNNSPTHHSAPPNSFAAAALKKEKEPPIRKDPLDEGAPRLVPVRTSQRVVMRRPPQKK